MLIFSLVIMLGFSTSYAINNLIILSDISYQQNEEIEKVTVKFSANVGNAVVREFTNPKRLVVDFENSALKSQKGEISVDSDSIVKIRCGQFMPTTSRVVLDLKQDVKYEVLKEGQEYVITILKSALLDNTSKEEVKQEEPIKEEPTKEEPTKEEPKENKPAVTKKLIRLNDISYKENKQAERITIKFSGNVGKATVKKLKDPKRLFIDFENSEVKSQEREVPINSDNIIKIR